MNRLEYPLSHEWHVAINRHSQEVGFDSMRFMYEAKAAADEVPRMVVLFKRERENALPQTHQQCSLQAPEPIKENQLSCCLGVKVKECPHLLALEKIERCKPEDIDAAKAWTCAAHIIGEGGDPANEGFMLTAGDRMFWDRVHANLAQSDEGEAA